MYADLGHFSRNPIRASWLMFVFPSLVIQYIGQAAYLLQNKNAYADPFFNAVPAYAAFQWIMLVFATLATIIASQAMISGMSHNSTIHNILGCFSLIDQAIQLNIFPRINSIRTSKTHRGQIYIPALNYALMVGSIALVLIFQSSEKLAALYGISVAGDMCLTSFFFVFIIRLAWRKPIWMIASYMVVFWTIDLLLLSGALLKVWLI